MRRLMASACVEQKGGRSPESDLLDQQVTLDQRRPEPRLQPIALQFFTAAGPARQGSVAASEEASCQLVNVAALIPSSRETVSRSSPRNSRSTAALLRCRDILPPRPSAATPDSCGRSASPGRPPTTFT